MVLVQFWPWSHYNPVSEVDIFWILVEYLVLILFFLGCSYDFYLFILVLIYSLYLYRPNSKHIYRQRNLYWIFFYLDLPNYISSPDNFLILIATIQHCIILKAWTYAYTFSFARSFPWNSFNSNSWKGF